MISTAIYPKQRSKEETFDHRSPKHSIALLLVVLAQSAMIFIALDNSDEADADVSGDDGNIHWELSGNTMTLSKADGQTSGDMRNYSQATRPEWEKAGAPWHSVRNIVIKDDVTSIGNYAFINAQSVQTFIIGGSVKSIGTSAFYWLTKITSISFPKSVESIGDCAFKYCTSLKTINFSEGLKWIGNEAFDSCSMNSVDLPDSLTHIGEYAFFNCTYLTQIAIPDTITSIQFGTFTLCTSLNSVTLPESITSIGGRQFYKCPSIGSFTIPSNVGYIGGEAFSECGAIPIYYNAPNLNPSQNCWPSDNILFIDANGGYVTGDRVDRSDLRMPSADAFVAPEGKIFKEYNTAKDGTGTSYLPGDTYSLSGKEVVYAIWEQCYTVTIVANNQEWGSLEGTTVIGGLIQGTPISVTDGTVSIKEHTCTAVPNTPTAQYTYGFDHWEGIPGDYVVTKDITITACFTRTLNTYTVTFAANDAEWGSLAGETVLRDVPYGTKVDISGMSVTVGTKNCRAVPNGPTAQYTYGFARWDDIPDDHVITGDATITACFTRTLNTYTLTFAANESGWGNVGRGSLENIPYGTAIDTSGSTVTVGQYSCKATPQAPTARYTYGFDRWDAPATVTGDVKITACFTRTVNTYTVTFDSSGGSAVQPRTVEYGNTVDKPADPTKEGSQFTGWFFDNREWDFGTQITGNITLVAHWMNQYIVTFDVQGHGDPVQSQILNEGSKAERPADPSCSGYFFRGWFTESSCKNMWDFDTVVEVSMTLYAKWDKAECSVSSDGALWTDYPTLEEGLAACGDDWYVKILDSRIRAELEISVPVTIRFNGETFLSPQTDLVLSSDVVFEGMEQMPLSIEFATGACLATDRDFNLTATFTDVAAQMASGKAFVIGLGPQDVAVAHQGYSANMIEDGIGLARVTDLPFAVMDGNRLAFYGTMKEAIAHLPGPSGDIFVLDYIQAWEGGDRISSHDVDLDVNRNIVLHTVIRVTDGTHSSFYVGGEELYNNGATVLLPQGAKTVSTLTGEIRMQQACMLNIGDVGVSQNIILGGGRTGAFGDQEIAKIRLMEDALKSRITVGFENLEKWAVKKQTEAGWIYELMEGCEYTFITSDRVSLMDFVSVNAPGFKANVMPEGHAAKLVASTSMVAYIKTQDGTFVGYTSINDAIEQSKGSDSTDNTVYILYRTTEKSGDQPTLTHRLDFDLVYDGTYLLNTVHQQVDSEGSTSKYSVDGSIATLIFSEGNSFTVTDTADLSKVYVDGTIILKGKQVLDLGGNWGQDRTLTLDLTDHALGTVATNVGDVQLDLVGSPGDGIVLDRSGNDLVLRQPSSGIPIWYMAVIIAVIALFAAQLTYTVVSRTLPRY